MDYISNQEDFAEFVLEAAKTILKKMPWDYDPVGDVAKVAAIITETYVLTAFRAKEKI